MRTLWISVLNAIILFASPASRVSAGDPVWQGSKEDTDKQVQDLLRQLTIKSDEFKRMDAKGSRRFDLYVKGLGFESINDLTKAMVGKPVPFYSLDLDRLRSIPQDQDIDPWSLLTETGGAIVPILAENKIRSSATVFIAPGVDKDKQPVKLGPLGSGRDTQLLREIQSSSCKCFVIRASALDRQFLGEGDKSQPSFMIRVMADGPGKLKKGDVLDAKQVFAELSCEAKKSRYDMPDRPGKKPKP